MQPKPVPAQLWQLVTIPVHKGEEHRDLFDSISDISLQKVLTHEKHLPFLAVARMSVGLGCDPTTD